jgi:hypothetical protein
MYFRRHSLRNWLWRFFYASLFVQTLAWISTISSLQISSRQATYFYVGTSSQSRSCMFSNLWKQTKEQQVAPGTGTDTPGTGTDNRHRVKTNVLLEENDFLHSNLNKYISKSKLIENLPLLTLCDNTQQQMENIMNSPLQLTQNEKSALYSNELNRF